MTCTTFILTLIHDQYAVFFFMATHACKYCILFLLIFIGVEAISPI